VRLYFLFLFFFLSFFSLSVYCIQRVCFYNFFLFRAFSRRGQEQGFALLRCWGLEGRWKEEVGMDGGGQALGKRRRREVSEEGIGGRAASSQMLQYHIIPSSVGRECVFPLPVIIIDECVVLYLWCPILRHHHPLPPCTFFSHSFIHSLPPLHTQTHILVHCVRLVGYCRCLPELLLIGSLTLLHLCIYACLFFPSSPLSP